MNGSALRLFVWKLSPGKFIRHEEVCQLVCVIIANVRGFEMLKKIFKIKKNLELGLGLGLRPGDRHYRAYVGPPEDYDLVSAMVFNLLTCLGLRQDHRLLDIGCGSLRNGRLLIPYLNKGNYFGIDPNKWLIEDGIKYEVGDDLVKIKRPKFFYSDSLDELDQSLCLDYAVAQSIFSHTGLDLLDRWLSTVSYHLKDNGILLATFLIGERDSEEFGWVYPGCVEYIPYTISGISAKHNLHFKLLNWFHPRQSWAAFYKEDYNISLLNVDDISWNKCKRLAITR